MRLLTLTNRYYLLFLFAVLAVWTGLLYFVLRWEVYDNIDEVLSYKKDKLIEYIQAKGRILENSSDRDFVISPAGKIAANMGDVFQDTLVFKSKKSYDEYRRITSYFELDGRPYKLSLILPHLEQDELVSTVAFTLPVLVLMILTGFSLVNRQLNRNLWRPFYEILGQFRQFKIDKGASMQFRHTHIREFRELQEGVQDLTSRSSTVYFQQKQFTENASHEIQTPLAIMQAKLESLFQQSLTKKQADILDDLFSATTRLSKINETLLLLARIDNNQFDGKSEVNLRSMVEEVIPFFDEQASKYDIETTIEISSSESIYANPTLVEILVTNLLKNAFVHNHEKGRIGIRIENQVLTVTNTGDPRRLSESKIFDRFFSGVPGKGGLGLGLSIVKSICDVNNWKVAYRQSDSIHEISIQW